MSCVSHWDRRFCSRGAGAFTTCIIVLSIVGCGRDDEERALYSIKSPDSIWIVDVAERSHNGTFSTAESYQIDNVWIRKQSGSEEPALIFSIDSDGDVTHNPVVTWVTNERLSISVANGSSIEHWSTRFRGIEVDVILR